MDRPDDVVAAEPKRPNFTEAFRRAIVEETLKPGASASRIAREHDLNVNMVFKWRQRYRKELEAQAARIGGPTEAGTALLPVNVIDVPSPPTSEPPMITSASCEVEIEVGKRRVRIRGLSMDLAERFLQDCLK
ncbi:transposase family protein [Paraburkholderia xenovorans LB400]|uniref:Transposase IS3/IS911 n=1 Tax=Paraburkholderia xenovorans (strain LB400) TaxID=266265 RepID=Q13HR3_PARXL|nr:transposase [Paraburkholderia xenovorans]ABE36376.1 Putative transposase IS3/IS911 [Paraburkholderia xenovorans LB400]AIP34180.1 transposase family protein [Paraburkholderia xenovorans LB400]